MSLFDIFKVSKIKAENEKLSNDLYELQKKMDALGITEYNEIQNLISQSNVKHIRLKDECSKLENKNEALNITISKQENTIKTQSKKLSKIRELYKSVDYSLNNFFNSDISIESLKIPHDILAEIESISPTVELKLHCMDVKSLRKEYRDNNKKIDDLLSKYSARYTTKSNKAIYNLMVIALKAELQNILCNLKFEKLDKSIDDIKKITEKYLKIVGDGNQSIASTLTKFIGEIELLFINAIKIEYNYYVKKEQARQEQLALRQQMKEEAEERKLLLQQQNKIEKEEEKYKNEIIKIQNLLNDEENNEEIQKLKLRISELQSQLADVAVKKEEIIKLQNGKAGNVYIISNLGSFGDNVFKIGMTRRIDPQERVNELGDASVPFKFDVHSFIFSDNAVDLEKKLHEILNNNRLNKVNLRKEFFNVSIDELENLVNDIEPTAEFNKTMLAAEFRQSQSTDEIYTNDYIYNDIDEDSDE
jgi:hypothetical protein